MEPPMAFPVRSPGFPELMQVNAGSTAWTGVASLLLPFP